MKCELDPDMLKSGFSSELGWALAFVERVPEVCAFEGGAYVGHHGGIGVAGGSSSASAVQSEVVRQPVACFRVLGQKLGVFACDFLAWG